MNMWFLLVTTLPTENATIRQRAWCTLKACDAAVLRDGVYLMPGQQACQVLFDRPPVAFSKPGAGE